MNTETTDTRGTMSPDDDMMDFIQQFPNVQAVKLVQNPNFMSYAKGRLGIEPLAVIYGDFQELVRTVENAAAAKAAKKGERSTGGGQASAYAGLTRAQAEQLKAWNNAYPELKMTAGEFLAK